MNDPQPPTTPSQSAPSSIAMNTNINTMKSPIKKMSHAGSKLASAAAHRGSHILDQASTAVQTAVGSSPMNPHQHRRRPPSSAGIRDKINKFDSVASRRKHDSSRPYDRSNDGDSSARGGSSDTAESDENHPHNQKYQGRNDASGMEEKENAVPQRPHPRDSPANGAKASPKPARHAIQRKLRETFSPVIHARDETALKERLRQLEEDNEALRRKNLLLERRCETAVDTALLRRVPNADQHESEKRVDPKKRLGEHPLISSPLRKHAKAVHESGESYSRVTVRKDPFSLFPPERPTKGGSAEGGGCHLGTLGVLACFPKGE